MKKSRHEKIVELIENEQIGTQEELAKRLNEAGFLVTQATVSRDIRQLHLSKVPLPDGTQKYALLQNSDSHLGDKYIRVLKDGFVSVDAAGNLLVLKTVSGMAMAVAASVDAMKLQEVVGSIAGDDTVMVAVRTPEEAKLLMGKIKGLIGE